MPDETMEIRVRTTGVEESKGKLAGLDGKIADSVKKAGQLAAAYLTLSTAVKGYNWAVELGVQEQTKNIRLRDYLKNMGLSWQEYGNRAIKAIDELTAKTTRDDDDIAKSFEDLLLYTRDYEKSLKYLALAQDISSSSTLEGADGARILGQVLGGNFMMIGRYLPVLRNTNEEFAALSDQDKITYALKTLQETFGGLAEQRIPMAVGQMEVYHRAVDDLGKAIGGHLLPAHLGFVGALTGTIEKITQFIHPAQTMKGEIAEVTGNFTTLMQTLITYRTPGWEKSATATEMFKNAVKTLNQEYGPYLGNLDLEKASLDDLKKARDRANEALIAETTLKYMLKDQDAEIQKLARLNAEYFTTTQRQQQMQDEAEKLRQTIGLTGEQITSFTEALKTAPSRGMDPVLWAINRLREGGGKWVDNIQDQYNWFRKNSGAMVDYAEKQGLITAAMNKNFGTHTEQILQQKRVTDATLAYGSALESLSGSLVQHKDLTAADTREITEQGSEAHRAAISMDELLKKMGQISGGGGIRARRPRPELESVTPAETPDWAKRQAELQQELQESLIAVHEEYNPYAVEMGQIQDLEDLRAQVSEMTVSDEEWKAERLLEIDTVLAKKRKALAAQQAAQEQRTLKDFLEGFKNVAAMGASIAESFGQRGFEAWKKLSEAQAIVDGLNAGISAWAWGMKYGGPPLAAATVAVSAGYTVAQIAAIERQKFAVGTGILGVRGAYGGDVVPALLQTGETVINRQNTQNYSVELSAMQTGQFRPMVRALESIEGLLARGTSGDTQVVVNGPGLETQVRQGDFTRGRLSRRGRISAERWY